MNNNLNRVPPGFRFHPTDEELVDYYLRKKVANKRIDLDVIKDIDLYKIEPWDLQEKCKIGSEEQTEWYFFSHKDKKYPTGTRTNRATTAGFWKATGRDKAIYCKLSLIGMRKTLVFYKGRAPNGQKSDWIMHEYRLETNENATPQEEGWVVCRVFKKRITTQRKGMDGDSGCWYDEQMGLLPELESPKKLPPTLDQMMYHHHHLHHGHGHHQQQHHNHNYGCKQELDLHYHIPQDPFLHLPQLESPKMPSPYATSLNKNSNVTGECHIPYGGNTSGINGIGMDSVTTQTTTRPITSSSEEHQQQQQQQQQHSQNNTNDDQVTDWRLLDKFVASQLSQEDVSKETTIANESLYPIPDMSVLLKQSANNNNTTTSNSKQQSDYTSNSNSDADLWSFTGKWD